ncbi:hypothetical protein IFT36_08120 [Frigoribacterium sp. CFBP 13605]|uniref:hypothetical protein n=1 Tax=Frigoribacterium sp. CFBP 13605 TaxID=2774034 RepID=UPI0019030691|nr:hypothetical protein [Frigoribacterium sp. CFBP 13605]MBD8140505.1 hypothetical protein [Frigoribacterium sp. CFBP 13605]
MPFYVNALGGVSTRMVHMAHTDTGPVGTLTTVIGQLLDPQVSRKFHGHIIVSSGGDETRYEVWADPETGCWESVDHAAGIRDVYNPIDGLLLTSPGQRDEEDVDRGTVENMPAHLGLFFPLRMGIWSRSRDRWRMTGATTGADGRTVVGLQALDDNSQGSLTVTTDGVPVLFREPEQDIVLEMHEAFGGRPDFWWKK